MLICNKCGNEKDFRGYKTIEIQNEYKFDNDRQEFVFHDEELELRNTISSRVICDKCGEEWEVDSLIRSFDAEKQTRYITKY